MKRDLSQLEISSDGNLTFVIGDTMKKVHIANNKSLANLARTNKIVQFYGAVIMLECII